jgi:hypothetical protein
MFTELWGYIVMFGTIAATKPWHSRYVRKGDRRIAAEQRGVLCQTSEEPPERTLHRVLGAEHR